MIRESVQHYHAGEALINDYEDDLNLYLEIAELTGMTTDEFNQAVHIPELWDYDPGYFNLGLPEYLPGETVCLATGMTRNKHLTECPHCYRDCRGGRS